MTKWIILVVVLAFTALNAAVFTIPSSPCHCPSDPVHCAQVVKPKPVVKPRPVNCRRVPAAAYQWDESTVLSHAQSDYHLNPRQLRLLKYCVEHHHV